MGPPDYQDYHEKFIGKHVPGSTSVGLKEITKEPSIISVFPNPASEYIIVNSQTKQDIFIYDLTGKVVKQFKAQNSEFKIEVGDLEKGIYLVKVGTVNGVATQKLVIE